MRSIHWWPNFGGHFWSCKRPWNNKVGKAKNFASLWETCLRYSNFAKENCLKIWAFETLTLCHEFIHNMFSFPRNMASWTIDLHNCKGPFGESFSNFVFTSTYKKLSLTYFIKHGTHHYFLPHVWNLILLHFSFCLMGLTSNSSSHFEDLVYILIN